MNLHHQPAPHGARKPLLYLLGALIPLLMAAPAHAGLKDAAEKGWACLKANGKAIKHAATNGASVLEFIATKPVCVGQLVTPPPAIPQIAMGITVGIATQQKLNTYDSCSKGIYGFVANPILGEVKAALNKAPNLPSPLDSLKGGLVNLTAENAVDLLTSIPGTEIVTGGIDCGCGLVDAGLRPEVVKEIYEDTVAVAKQCTGFLEELGPLGKGIVVVGGAVVTGYVDVIKDPQHMPVGTYYQRFWEPYVESVALGLSATPPRDVWTATVKPIYDNCVQYFDSHNQYQSTAVLTCDGMRDGTRDFVGGGFTRAVYNRTWDLLTPNAAEYYGRYLVKQQTDLARAAGLNDVVIQAMAKRLFRDFGLDARGNAKRNDRGDVAWAAGSLGEKTRNAKSTQFSGGDPKRRASELPNRDTVLDALIAKVYNNSATVKTVIGWQNAYPAIMAAKCTMPPRVRIPGVSNAAPSGIPTTTLTCADQTLPTATRQAASIACNNLAAGLKNELNLVCPSSADLSKQELTIGGATYNGRVILVRGLLRYNDDGVLQYADPASGIQNFTATFGIVPMRADWVNGVMGPQKGSQKTMHFLVQITPPAGFKSSTPGKLIVNGTQANFDSDNFNVVASNEPPLPMMDGVTLAAPPPRADMLCHTAECKEELIRMAATCKQQFADFAKNPANQSGDTHTLSPAKSKEQAAILSACDEKMKAIARASVAAGNTQPVGIGVGGRVPGTRITPGGSTPVVAPPVITSPVPTVPMVPMVPMVPAVVAPPVAAPVIAAPIVVAPVAPPVIRQSIPAIRPPLVVAPPATGQLRPGGMGNSQLGGSMGSSNLGGGLGGGTGLTRPVPPGCTAQVNSPGSYVCNDATAVARCEQASRGQATCTLRPGR